MARRLLQLLAMRRLALVAVLATRTALACPPAAAVDGDGELAREITGVLAQRGVGAAAPRCPAAVAHVERRGARIAVRIADQDVEREVTSVATAATVIESFARRDLTAPLLRPAIRSASPAPPVEQVSTRGVQLFAAAEAAHGDDTRWFGGHIGACITLGPVCAAARLRFARLDDTKTVRLAHELLLGVDVPLPLSAATLSPGVALGLGAIHTRAPGSDAERETGGLRADVHATLSIPIGRRTAFDLAISGVLIGRIHVEGSQLSLPDEPHALLRLGAGIRYGGL